MSDFALRWDAEALTADLAVVDDDVLAEEGIRTAVLLSLFLDRRAEDDDQVPGSEGERRGWWGDEFSDVDGDRIGSRLWLLDRAKRLPDIARRAEELVREALSWMVDDLVATDVDVTATLVGAQLRLVVVVHRPKGDPVSFRYAHVWQAEEER